jgi:hypothetical protein
MDVDMDDDGPYADYLRKKWAREALALFIETHAIGHAADAIHAIAILTELTTIAPKDS